METAAAIEASEELMITFGDFTLEETVKVLQEGAFFSLLFLLRRLYGS